MFTGPICSMRCRKPAASVFFCGQLFTHHVSNLSVGAQYSGFGVDFSQAARFKMLQIRTQFGHFAGAIGTIVAQLVNCCACVLKLQLHFCQLLPQTVRFGSDRLRLSQRFSAQRRQLQFALCKLCAFADALLALRLCSGALLLNSQHSPLQIGVQPVDALEGCFRAAPTLFQPGQLCSYLCSFLLQSFALLAQNCQLRLLLFMRCLSRCVLGLEALRLFAFLLDYGVLGFARILVAGGLRSPVLHAPVDALRLCFHLLQRRALIGGIALGNPAFFAASFEQSCEFLDSPCQRGGFCLGLR